MFVIAKGKTQFQGKQMRAVAPEEILGSDAVKILRNFSFDVEVVADVQGAVYPLVMLRLVKGFNLYMITSNTTLVSFVSSLFELSGVLESRKWTEVAGWRGKLGEKKTIVDFEIEHPKYFAALCPAVNMVAVLLYMQLPQEIRDNLDVCNTVPISEDMYLSYWGVGSAMSDWVLDKLRGNRMLKTQRGTERFMREGETAAAAYAERRQQARMEYQYLCKRGVVREMTEIERALLRARGHGDNPSVQAARRICEKRGYDWRTGRKI